MPILTDEMKQAITDLHLCYVATVTPEGRPNLSPKGSLRAWDGDHLVFADIASPQTVENVAANPYVEINIVNPFSRRGFRFKGRAEVFREGEVFTTVTRELREQHGPVIPVNGVVKVRVETALPVLSPAYTCNPSANEADIRRTWLAIYGVKPIGGAL
jgi:predicted pyridoxine 5'-phosphate oxidase superfamily flavin-nucleotide-binding protein